MANSFKSAVVNVTVSLNGFNAPSGTTVIIIGASITNYSDSNASLTSYLQDNSAGGATSYLTYGTVIPPGGNVTIAGGEQKIVLESLDQLVFTSNVNGALKVNISYMEIS